MIALERLLNLPGTVRHAASRAIGLLHPAADLDLGHEFPAILPVCALKRVHRGDVETIAGIRIPPLRSLSCGLGLQGTVDLLLVHAVHVAAHIASQGRAEDGSADNCRDPPAARADLCAGADLSGINLQGAYLKSADLSNANLTGANFIDVYLYDANLDGAILTGANFSKAIWPDGRTCAFDSIGTCK